MEIFKIVLTIAVDVDIEESGVEVNALTNSSYVGSLQVDSIHAIHKT